LPPSRMLEERRLTRTCSFIRQNLEHWSKAGSSGAELVGGSEANEIPVYSPVV
jgi:hypothetical protein